MTGTSRAGKLAHHLPVAAGLALALPTLLAQYPPMNDLPLHEGVVGVLRHLGDDSWFPRGLYTLNLGHPNQLFHCLAWFFSLFVSTAWACKVVIAGAQVATLWAAARFADHLGRSRWGAVLVAPLALGFTYYWGLVANLVGFAAFLYALPRVDEASRRPSPRGVLTTCALLVLVYLAHESLFVALAGVITALAVFRPLAVRATAMRLGPALFAAIVALGHQVYAARLFTSVIKASSPTQFLSLRDKLGGVPTVLFGSHDLAARLMLFGLALTGAVALAVGRRRDVTPAAPSEDAVDARPWRATLQRHRFEIIGLVFFFIYLVAPFSWRGATLLHERFLGPAWALLVISAAPRAAAPLVGRIASAVLPAGILLLSWPQFLDANVTNRDFEVVLASVPRGSAVASVAVLPHAAAERVFSPGMFPARSLALVGGRAGLSLTVSAISPVLMAAPYRWEEYEARMLRNAASGFVPAHDLQRFGFLVIRANELPVQRLVLAALAPDADLVEARGEWMLFRSKHDLLPLTAPATAPPSELETLAARLAFLAARSRGAQSPQ